MAEAVESREIKLGEAVADRIVDGIIADGWSVGSNRGSLADLTSRYGVSVAVIREAVRQLEQNGFGAMRRGPSGGLVISRPPLFVATQSLATYLLVSDVDLFDVADAVEVIEDRNIPLICERVRAPDVPLLRSLGARIAASDPGAQSLSLHLELSRHLNRILDNPILQVYADLFFIVLGLDLNVEMNASGMHSRVRQWAEAGAEAMEAIARDDPAAAVTLLRSARRSILWPVIEQANHRKQSLKDDDRMALAEEFLGKVNEGSGEKQSQLLARAIARRIAAMGKAGAPLGCEAALIADYGVSRSIYREAMRILEVHRIIFTKRGRNGGPVISEPDPAYALQVAVKCMSNVPISPRQYDEARRMLYPALADFAARQSDPAGPRRLMALLEREYTDYREFAPALGKVAGNEALALMQGFLMQLEDQHHPPASTRIREQDRQALTHMVKAIAAGDSGLARRYMRDALHRADPDADGGRTRSSSTASRENRPMSSKLSS